MWNDTFLPQLYRAVKVKHIAAVFAKDFFSPTVSAHNGGGAIAMK